jgi:phage-related protein
MQGFTRASRRDDWHGKQDHPWRVEDHQGDTYRAVYTVKFAGWVYVLHCFQRKSKSGIATPKPDMDLINTRLKAAKQDFEVWQAKQGARK